MVVSGGASPSDIIDAPDNRNSLHPICIENAFSAGNEPWPLRDSNPCSCLTTPETFAGGLMATLAPFCVEGDREGGCFAALWGSADVKASNSDLDCAEALETNDPPCVSSGGHRSCGRSSENMIRGLVHVGYDSPNRAWKQGPSAPASWSEEACAAGTGEDALRMLSIDLVLKGVSNRKSLLWRQFAGSVWYNSSRPLSFSDLVMSASAVRSEGRPITFRKAASHSASQAEGQNSQRSQARRNVRNFRQLQRRILLSSDLHAV